MTSMAWVCPTCGYPWHLHSWSEITNKICNGGNTLLAPPTSVGCGARGHVTNNYNSELNEVCIVCGADLPKT